MLLLLAVVVVVVTVVVAVREARCQQDVMKTFDPAAARHYCKQSRSKPLAFRATAPSGRCAVVSRGRSQEINVTDGVQGV